MQNLDISWTPATRNTKLLLQIFVIEKFLNIVRSWDAIWVLEETIIWRENTRCNTIESVIN